MDIYCEACIDTPGRIYNNDDVNSGQWAPCDHEALTYENLQTQLEDIVDDIANGPVDLSEDLVDADDYIVKRLASLMGFIQAKKLDSRP